MDGSQLFSPLEFSGQSLGRLMPMFLHVDETGLIRSIGPTLLKLLGTNIIGCSFDQVFQVRRPADFKSVQNLLQQTRLRFVLRGQAKTQFKGVCVPLHGSNDVLINLSFGYGIRDAVREHGLSDTDFAPTDLAIELLYLAEAKTAVMGEVERMADRLRGAKQRAEEQAFTDALTGLGNRRAMSASMQRLMQSRTGFAVLHLDLDYFKQVNDTLGHAAGDHVLKVISSILLSSVRGGDFVARVGGDEFVIFLPGVTDANPIQRVGHSVLSFVSQGIQFDGQACKIGVSIGAALVPGGTTLVAEEIIHQADEALYAAKRAGRGRIMLFESQENSLPL